MMRNPGWWFSISAALACASATGAEADFSDAFHRDRYELALMSGGMFSPIGADRGRSTENYTLSGLQIGWMLTEPGKDAWYRGNVELSLEAMGGAVYEGKGSFIAGGTLWVRYNFVQPNWRVVPYLQVGGGAEGTDMDRELIGQVFNFNICVSAGARYFVAPKWAVNLELRYQHISNAKLSKHDIGINSAGPMVGVSYFF